MRFLPANAERITAALKALPIKLCGYSGLMLPVMEDEGLARAADEQRITVGSLLHYSGLADKTGTYGALAAGANAENTNIVQCRNLLPPAALLTNSCLPITLCSRVRLRP
jgi:hypothetical protein